MEVYFVRDLDPMGGFLEVFLDLPDVNTNRVTWQEIRKGELPDGIEEGIQNAQIIPDPKTQFDKFLSPYFKAATVVWTREGGFVNGE